MRAGKLRRRVALERKEVSQGDYGEEIVAWAKYAAVWAAVEPVSGREFWTARQAEQGELTTRIRIRHRDDVQVADRVVWDGRTFDIETVLADERERECELMCRELRD